MEVRTRTSLEARRGDLKTIQSGRVSLLGIAGLRDFGECEGLAVQG